MNRDFDTFASMAEEISLLRDLAAHSKDDPHWILVRACADHLAQIMDHLATQSSRRDGEMPWWTDFQKGDDRTDTSPH